ncbi:hypothetical protein QYM36_006381 [Artemia franciscana]|uniref:PDZ domain-containing protein n=1 Tax=Artemia franciscana TaxID=6661 RepID=A0AA88HV11_ARTSF|nr:hypothetical protein QYM36_006381 [Artemia franciscana]
MKVTVCFGQLRILVPCGSGNLLVRDLAEQAVHRYCKASGQVEDTWNKTATLRSSNGAILDPDDQLTDVVDDREVLSATLGPIVIQQPIRQGSRGTSVKADGTSASSEGSPSPEPIQIGSHTFQPFARQAIEVTGDETEIPLQVRRGSEPSLNRLPPDVRTNLDIVDPKRWSAAVLADSDNNSKNDSYDKSGDESFLEERRVGSGREDELSAFARFVRNSNRMSMQPYGDFHWEDAADNAVNHFRSRSQGEEPRPGSMRREPVGSTCPPPEPSGNAGNISERTETVVLINDGSALGIHVVPAYDRQGRDLGLNVQGVEPGGRVSRDGRISAGDRIIEINGRSLQYVPFQRSQEIFRQALQCNELQLAILKKNEPKKQRIGSEERLICEENERMVDKEVATISSKNTKRTAEPGALNILATGNTRKIGRMYEIDLVKGTKGLGFSVTTRDNPAGGDCPIYVKKILPEGAAIEDGRLKAGDRLLEVNGISITGKTQEEAVSILRSIPQKGIGHLVVSRHDVVESSPALPRKLGVSIESLSGSSNFRNKEILTLDIPVHDTEKAGLGISVKGKTATQDQTTIDLGIFIKSVINGGAASRDGRLKPNDQLLSVNGTPLAGMTNSEAMSTLRRLVHSEGPVQGCITLTVARKVGDSSGRDSTSSMLSNSSGCENGNKSDGGVTDNSGNSDSSGRTVIFIGENPSANNNRDSNRNQVLVLPAASSEERLQPPPRAPPAINPMLNRLVGTRNESYFKATRDTTASSQIYDSSRGQRQVTGQHHKGQSIYSTAQGEHILLQEDYTMRNMQKQRGESQESHPPTYRKDSYSTNDAALSDRMSEKSDRPSDTETLPYESQTSLEESASGFTRDQPGRQSMSEKRHATLDAKSTDTYQRQKKAKEERTKQPDREERDEVISPRDAEIRKKKETGPSLGLKKSSSLESLQTRVHEIRMQNDSNYPYMGPGVKPMRSWDEREKSQPTPLEEKIGKENIKDDDLRSGVPQVALDLADQNLYGRTPGDVKKVSKTKKSSLLRGLGSVFRFGKHRKDDAPLEIVSRSEYADSHELSRHMLRRTLPHERLRATTEPPANEVEREESRTPADEEQRKVQEQYRRLVERGMGPPGFADLIPPSSRPRIPPSDSRGPPPYHHTQRSGDHPRTRQDLDHGESMQSLVAKDCSFSALSLESFFKLCQIGKHDSVRPASSQEIVHGRSSSFDMTKRQPTRYEPQGQPPNYVNVEEKHEQISRRQQQYRSQRSHRESRESKADRPISNYYEYESLQNRQSSQHHHPPRFQSDLPTIQQGSKPKPPYPLPPCPPQGYQQQTQRKQDRGYTTGYGRDKRMPLQSNIFDPLCPPRQQTQHSHPRYSQGQSQFQVPQPVPPSIYGSDRRPGAPVLSGSKV